MYKCMYVHTRMYLIGYHSIDLHVHVQSIYVWLVTNIHVHVQCIVHVHVQYMYIMAGKTDIIHVHVPTQRVAELLKDGKLGYDKNTGLLQLADTDAGLSAAQDTNGEIPTSPFSNYLHSEHEPVSAYFMSEMFLDSLVSGPSWLCTF